MKYTLVNGVDEINKDMLEEVANAAFSVLGEKAGEVELSFISQSDIRELNHKYRHMDKSTDVLTFTVSEEPLIGQIFICYNEAVRQAQELKKDVQEEVSLLFIHGILHLYGYDHENEDQAKEMEEMEVEILKIKGYKR